MLVALFLRGVPRADPGKSSRSDARDVPGIIAIGRGRKLNIRADVDARQSLQEIRRSSFRNPSFAPDHQILLQCRGILSGTEHGENDSRVAAHILHLLPHSHVADHELVVFNTDPHYRNLRTAVSIQSNQMGVWSCRNEFADRFRYRLGCSFTSLRLLTLLPTGRFSAPFSCGSSVAAAAESIRHSLLQRGERVSYRARSPVRARRRHPEVPVSFSTGGEVPDCAKLAPSRAVVSPSRRIIMTVHFTSRSLLIRNAPIINGKGGKA